MYSVTLPSDPFSLEADWSKLVRRTGAPVWMRPGWIRAWMETRGTGALELPVVRGPHGLRALAAIQRKPSGFGSASIVWQSILAEDEDGCKAIAVALMARGGDRMALQFGFPGTNGFEAMQRAAEAASYRTAIVPYLRSPFVLTTGCFADYLAARSRADMKELSRRRRQLEQRGAITFSIHDGREGVDDLLAEAFEVEKAGSKGDAGTAVVSRSESCRYYTGLARWAAREGLLRLAFLRLSGRAIAFNLMLQDEQRLYCVRSGYANEFAKSRPGFIALLECIQCAFERGCRSMELLGHDEPWKRVFSQGVHDRVTLLAFRSTSTDGLAQGVRKYLMPLAPPRDTSN